jgi:hypothetical protein
MASPYATAGLPLDAGRASATKPPQVATFYSQQANLGKRYRGRTGELGRNAQIGSPGASAGATSRWCETLASLPLRVPILMSKTSVPLRSRTRPEPAVRIRGLVGQRNHRYSPRRRQDCCRWGRAGRHRRCRRQGTARPGEIEFGLRRRGGQAADQSHRNHQEDTLQHHWPLESTKEGVVATAHESRPSLTYRRRLGAVTRPSPLSGARRQEAEGSRVSGRPLSKRRSRPAKRRWLGPESELATMKYGHR